MCPPQVAMQRLVMLASVCLPSVSTKSTSEPAGHVASSSSGLGSWIEQYQRLLLGPSGENICTEAGRHLAQGLVERLQQHKSQCPLSVSVENGSTGQAELRLHIVAPKDVLKQVRRLLLLHLVHHANVSLTSLRKSYSVQLRCPLVHKTLIFADDVVSLLLDMTETYKSRVQAINWDCRIEAAAAAVVQGEFNEGAFGCDIR